MIDNKTSYSLQCLQLTEESKGVRLMIPELDKRKNQKMRIQSFKVILIASQSQKHSIRFPHMLTNYQKPLGGESMELQSSKRTKQKIKELQNLIIHYMNLHQTSSLHQEFFYNLEKVFFKKKLQYNSPSKMNALRHHGSQDLSNQNVLTFVLVFQTLQTSRV